MSFSIVGKTAKLDTAEDVAPFIKDITPGTQEVHLGGNSLGVDASIAIASALRKSPLRLANLDDIFTGRLITEIPTALDAFCTVFRDIPHLRELNLNDNAFGGRSVKPIVDLLSAHTSLEVLRLNNNGLGPAGGTEIANALYDGAQKAKAENKTHPLRVLVCGRNRLENGSAPAWARAFSALPNLEELHMPQDGIRPEGIAAIVAALAKSCPNLRILDLQDNTATLRGSAAIAAGIPRWPRLEQLDLNDCLLRARGSDWVVSSLKGAASLTHLRIQSNEMEPPTITKLIDIVTSLPSIKSVEINGNRGDPEDALFEDLRTALSAKGATLDEELDEMEEEWDDDDDDEEFEHLEALDKANESEDAGHDATDEKDSADLANELNKVL